MYVLYDRACARSKVKQTGHIQGNSKKDVACCSGFCGQVVPKILDSPNG